MHNWDVTPAEAVALQEQLRGRVQTTDTLRDNGETIGMVVRTRAGSKPVYVSLGHRISLASAVAVVLRCGAGYRIPEPTHLADILAAPGAAP